MIDVAFIPRLKQVIADCLADFTTYTTEVEDFQDAVIANAGGIIPMVKFEYHTGIEAFRHGAPVLDSFVFDRVPYGFTDAGLIRLIDNTPIPFSGQRGFTSLYTVHKNYDGIGRYQQIGNVLRRMQLRTLTEVESGTGAILPTSILGQYQDFNGIAGSLTSTQLLDYPSLITDGDLLTTEVLTTDYSNVLGNAFTASQYQVVRIANLFIPLNVFQFMDVQFSEDQWTVGIGNTLSFYDTDWNMTRYMKFDEPYYPSRVINEIPYWNPGYGNITQQMYGNQFMAERNGNLPKLSFQHAQCKCLYASPYAYLVYKDRTVVYYVD